MGNGNRDRVGGRGGPQRQRNHLRRGQGPNEKPPVAKGYRTSWIFRPDRVLVTDEDLEAFKSVLDEAAVRATATD